jgi:hypothetical protein
MKLIWTVIHTTARNRIFFVYDGGGDYYSVLRTKPGEQVKIIFDPQKMLQSPENAVPKVRWDKAHAYLSKLFEIYERLEREKSPNDSLPTSQSRQSRTNKTSPTTIVPLPKS